MKKTAAFIIALLWVLTAIPAVSAAEQDEQLDISAPSAILMHPSGKVLYEKDSAQRMAPASVTKIMTLLLTMEAIDSGHIAYDDIVTASAHAASMTGSGIWLEEGEQFTVDEMIKCVAVASANDCSVSLAEYIAGSEPAFVAMMNERALELGMYNTNFVNCCGLEAEGHYTTAADVAIMSCELIKHEKIFDYTTIWMDTIRDGEFGLTNTNKLIKTYDGMKGLKTGYTSQAKYCLSAVAEREGMELIAVVLGGETSESRNKDISAMLNYGFAVYSQVEISPDKPLMPVTVELGEKNSVAVKLLYEDPTVIEKKDIPLLEKNLEIAESVKAPVKKGDEIGTFSVNVDGKLFLKVPVVAAEDVEKLSVLGIWKCMAELVFMR